MTNKHDRKQTGQLGEQRAAHFLFAAGYTLVDMNWRCKLGEIDIVARDGETFVFVEVRTKRSTNYGDATSSITPQKLRRMQRLAYAYLQYHRLPAMTDFRIDVIAIVWREPTATLTHLRAVG